MRHAQIFSGSSHPTLVDGICDRLGQKRGKADLTKFSNGETSVQIRPPPPHGPLPGLCLLVKEACAHQLSRNFDSRPRHLHRPERQRKVRAPHQLGLSLV